MSFRVDLDTFRGPLDLLLFLVRKHEVEITDIPIALITDQYLAHLTVLEKIDVNAVGDFLDMASTLIEIKSRLVLPRGDEEVEELSDPRENLVQRLLEYKKYKDAASILEEQSRRWQQRHVRLSDDLPPRKIDPAQQPIHEVEMWDLVSAFGRIMRDHDKVKPSNIVYDETPIHVWMQRIHDGLVENGQVSFSEMFSEGMHKSALIGVFLAILELVRHHCVIAEQTQSCAEIVISRGEKFDESISISSVDSYDHGAESG